MECAFVGSAADAQQPLATLVATHFVSCTGPGMLVRWPILKLPLLAGIDSRRAAAPVVAS